MKRRETRPRLEPLERRDVPATLPPTGLAAVGSSASSIVLSWTAPKDPTVTGYDVIEQVWIPGTHGGKGSPTGGHYVYNTVAKNEPSTTPAIGGLKPGSYHTYFVAAEGPAGASPLSGPVSGATWSPPAYRNGPTIFLLSSGAVWSGPVAATSGLSTQVSLLISGNPLKFAVVSGPSTVSIDPQTGVILYTPGPKESGIVSATFSASNALGSINQTIQFNVSAYPTLSKPTIKLSGTTLTYTGFYQTPSSASVVGTDGKTPVAGSVVYAYDGPGGSPHDAGTYRVLATFTSADARYGNATLVSTLTINKATPVIGSLNAPSIAFGTATTLISGNIWAGPATPAGEYVIVTVGGLSQAALINPSGGFSTAFPTASLPVGTANVTFSYGGDRNFTAAANATSTITVLPLAAPVVTLNPVSQDITLGDPVSFTATASGTPIPSVQWQVSTDGGLTFTDITGNSSAQTSSLSFTPSTFQNGYKYRAVFTNSTGTVTSAVATLTVNTDTGGGG